MNFRAGVRDAVAVVANRENTAINFEPLFDESFQSPEGFIRDGKAGGSIAANGDAGRITDCVLAVFDVSPELIAAQCVDKSMPVAM